MLDELADVIRTHGKNLAAIDAADSGKSGFRNAAI